ncbi:MAG: DNA translocase FtsK, partial [Chloroflexi bacterium]|nr:DNA translocase FtsK [Chloroflexota bacterium]
MRAFLGALRQRRKEPPEVPSLERPLSLGMPVEPHWDEELAPEGVALAEAAAGVQKALPLSYDDNEDSGEAGEAEEASGGPLPRTERWQLPPPDLLEQISDREVAPADNRERARLIEDALASYGVEAKVVQINPGPAVTQFGVEPGWDHKYREVRERDEFGRIKLDKDGKPKVRIEEVSRTRVKVERITALSNNLAMALAAPTVRIEAPVPGKSVVGIEVPNQTMGVVSLRSLIESPSFQRAAARSKLALALGKGVAGESVAADLAKMPHLLIAGATGSGKSVCINSIISCLLMHATPEDVRFLMVDPKRVELVAFNSVPHLLAPVVVD